MITKTIKLPIPILRGKKEIKEVQLTEPSVLALQGLETMSIIRGNTDQLCILLPRITDLTETEVMSLNFKNLCAFSLGVTGFLGQ